MKKYARLSSVTNKGINEGYIFNDGEYYCETKEEAENYIKSLKLNPKEEFNTIGTNNEWFFWTTWHNTLTDDDDYYDEKGNLYSNYSIEIIETLTSVIEIKAKNKESAFESIKNQYKNCEIVLDHTNIIDYEIKHFDN